MMLNTQYNTPNVGLFKLFLLTHFVPRRVKEGPLSVLKVFTFLQYLAGCRDSNPRCYECSRVCNFRRFRTTKCRLLNVVSFGSIYCTYVKDSSSIKLHSIEAWTQGWEFALVALLERTTRAICYLQKEQQERISPFALYKKSKLLLLLFLKERLDQNELIAIFTFLNT